MDTISNTQLKAILRGCEASLRLVQYSPDYQQFIQNQAFTNSNDFTLGDAIQAINEVLEAMSDVEFATHQ